MARLDAHWHQTRVYHLKSSSLALGRVWWSLAGSALVASVTLNSTSVFSSTESGNRRRPQHCGISIETVLCFAGCSTTSSASHQKPVAGAPLCVPSGDNLSIFSHCQTLLRQTCIFENLWPRGSLGVIVALRFWSWKVVCAPRTAQNSWGWVICHRHKWQLWHLHFSFM